MQGGRVGLPKHYQGGCLHAELFQNGVYWVYFSPQQPHPQGRLNAIGRFLANVKQVSLDGVKKIGLDDTVC